MNLLLLDVEDTLFDWLGMWSQSFEALLAGLTSATRMPRHELLPIFRRLHIAAGTAERGVASDDSEVFGICPSAMQILAEELEENLSLKTTPFPGVIDTLGKLRDRGFSIAAHTDTPLSIAADRLVQLGLDGAVEVLFAPADAGVTTFRRVRRSPRYAEVVVMPHAKPDPRCIDVILSRFGASAAECSYVGDSKLKDISMARQAGVKAILAEYPGASDSGTRQLLRAVGHCVDADMACESALASIETPYKLANFEQLLQLL